MNARRVTQLVASSIILGLAIALLLDTRLGADGFSTLVDGLSRQTGLSFWMPNAVVSTVFVGVAWAFSVRPGVGSVLPPVIIGFTVSALQPILPAPESFTGRGVELAVAFGLAALGVAGYLAASFGAGPAEALALALRPIAPFRWGYSAIQIGCALGGWALGANIGVATVLVMVALGPVVEVVSRTVFRTAPSA